MKIFKMDDYMWYMAETLEDAFQAWADDCNEFPEELQHEHPEARELTEDELDELDYVADPYNEPEKVCSFRAEMQRRLAAGNTEAQMFATTEY